MRAGARRDRASRASLHLRKGKCMRGEKCGPGAYAAKARVADEHCKRRRAHRHLLAAAGSSAGRAAIQARERWDLRRSWRRRGARRSGRRRRRRSAQRERAPGLECGHGAECVSSTHRIVCPRARAAATADASAQPPQHCGTTLSESRKHKARASGRRSARVRRRAVRRVIEDVAYRRRIGCGRCHVARRPERAHAEVKHEGVEGEVKRARAVVRLAARCEAQ